MAIRYYPASKVITNLDSSNAKLLDVNGVVYKGKYYVTYDGKAFSGATPQEGPNEPLLQYEELSASPALAKLNTNVSTKIQEKVGAKFVSRVPGKPNFFYPQPTEDDYRKGYLIRYFTKKENERGFITEISKDEFESINNGTADYDISIYLTTKILWKISGPLNSQRKSQYNIIPGIVETNQRLTEEANKFFVGIIDFIGGDYAKFARPTP